MEIKVGNRYKRVDLSHAPSTDIYIGQEVIITYVDMDAFYVHFKRKLRDGSWEGGKLQPIELFNKRFKPFQIQMRNK